MAADLEIIVDGTPIPVYLGESSELAGRHASDAAASATLASAARVRAQNSVPFETYAALAAATGMVAGDDATVLVADAGTHTDPVVGGTVDNAGRYEYSASPAGWERVADLDSQTAEDLKVEVEAIVDEIAAESATLSKLGISSGITYFSFTSEGGLTNTLGFKPATAYLTSERLVLGGGAVDISMPAMHRLSAAESALSELASGIDLSAMLPDWAVAARTREGGLASAIGAVPAVYAGVEPGPAPSTWVAPTSALPLGKPVEGGAWQLGYGVEATICWHGMGASNWLGYSNGTDSGATTTVREHDASVMFRSHSLCDTETASPGNWDLNDWGDWASATLPSAENDWGGVHVTGFVAGQNAVGHGLEAQLGVPDFDDLDIPILAADSAHTGQALLASLVHARVQAVTDAMCTAALADGRVPYMVGEIDSLGADQTTTQASIRSSFAGMPAILRAQVLAKTTALGTPVDRPVPIIVHQQALCAHTAYNDAGVNEPNMWLNEAEAGWIGLRHPLLTVLADYDIPTLLVDGGHAAAIGQEFKRVRAGGIITHLAVTGTLLIPPHVASVERVTARRFLVTMAGGVGPITMDVHGTYNPKGNTPTGFNCGAAVHVGTTPILLSLTYGDTWNQYVIDAEEDVPDDGSAALTFGRCGLPAGALSGTTKGGPETGARTCFADQFDLTHTVNGRTYSLPNRLIRSTHTL